MYHTASDSVHRLVVARVVSTPPRIISECVSNDELCPTLQLAKGDFEYDLWYARRPEERFSDKAGFIGSCVCYV